MPAPAGSSATSSGTPPRSARPSSTGLTVHEVAATPGRSPARLPRRHQPRHLARPPRRRRDRAARDAARPGGPGRLDTRRRPADLERTTATPGGSAPGGVLVVGASASGRPDRRRAQPGRTRRRPRGRAATPACPAGYRGIDILWWLESTGRLARTIDDVAGPGRGPARDRRCSSSGATTRRGTDGVDLGRPAGARGAAHRAARAFERPPADFATTSPPPSVPRTPPGHGSSTRRPLRRAGRPGERGGTPAAATRGASRAAPDAARPPGRGHRHGAARHRVPRRTTRGCEVPVTDADGTIRQDRGVTPAPGLYVVGQRFQHRRDSATSTAPATTPHDVVAHLSPRRLGAPGPERPARRGAGGMTRRYDVVVVGGRVAGASTALLLARAGPAVALVDRGRYGSRHAVDARPDAGRGAAAVPLGRARPASSRPGTPRCGAPTFHYADGERRSTSRSDPRAGRRRALRPAPARARPAPRRRRRGGRRRRAARDDG